MKRLSGGRGGRGSGEGEEAEFAARAAAGREGVAVFFEGLAGDGGAAGVFADGGEEIVELDGGDVPEAGLQAEILGGGDHGGAGSNVKYGGGVVSLRTIAKWGVFGN